MYTSLVALALSGCFPHAEDLSTPASWQSDYRSAWTKGHAEQKPLALLFGSGTRGWEKLSKEGELGKEAMRLLESKYVCVYVDTSIQDGNRLATGFQLGDGPGLVLSDRTGDLQAFRYQGKLSNEEMERFLQKYADPERVVSTTETSVTEVRSYYPPSMASAPVVGSYQQSAPAAYSAAPVSYQPAPMSYQPAYQPTMRAYYPSVQTQGGCANGRCGR